MPGKNRRRGQTIPTTLLTLAADFYHSWTKALSKVSNVMVRSGKGHFSAERPPAFLCRNSKTGF
jgi:hypothetical protein